ncbi:MAG: transporter [Nitrospirota bacterium]
MSFKVRGVMIFNGLIFFIIFLLSAPGEDAWATHASLISGYGYSGPITTVAATTLQRHQGVFGLQIEFLKSDRFSERELKEFARRDEEVHNIDYLNKFSAGISYGITDSTSIHASIPYVYRNNIQESEPPDEIHDHGDSKGLGDMAIYFHHRFIKTDSLNLESSLLFGLKIPTGKTSERDREGKRFEAEFQPGTGSWDPSFGIAATKRAGSLSLDANLLYTLVTEGTQDTDLGDMFNYNLSVSHRSMKKPIVTDLIIEANGIWIQKEKVHGVKDENSGGNIIFLSPGIRLTFRDSLVTYFSFGFPFLQDLEGEQNDADYRIVFGIDISL